MKKRWISLLGVTVLVSSLAVYASFDFGSDLGASQTRRIGSHQVDFLSEKEADAYLANETDFSLYNSQLDLSLRLGEDRSAYAPDENERQLIELISDAGIPWHEGQVSTFHDLLETVYGELNEAGLCIWPDDLKMIKSNGKAQFGAYYTTGSAIVVPWSQMKFLFVPPRAAQLARTMAHEVWHVASRRDPELRKRAYEVFGFERADQFSIPPEIRERIITNPDVEDIGYVVSLGNGTSGQRYLIVLQSETREYEGLRSPVGVFSTIADYMEVVIYPVTESGEVIDQPQPLEDQLDPRIGTISPYRLGPDEVVAEAVEALLARSAGGPTHPETTQNSALLDQLRVALSCGEPEPK
ncbi:MAG: hypothetical protein V2J51_09945 [Erythrobacter sp.]|jgi:hypothetical protein|nr:hypothetical protein [Erythrobacter sp.]